MNQMISCGERTERSKVRSLSQSQGISWASQESGFRIPKPHLISPEITQLHKYPSGPLTDPSIHHTPNSLLPSPEGTARTQGSLTHNDSTLCNPIQSISPSPLLQPSISINSDPGYPHTNLQLHKRIHKWFGTFIPTIHKALEAITSPIQ